MSRRLALGGPVPRRNVISKKLDPPDDGAGTTRSRVRDRLRPHRRLHRHPSQPPPRQEHRPADRPIIPTRRAPSAWTALPEVKIYAAHGQQYEPVDAEMVLSYSEAKDGQMLEEGITESGSMAPSPPRHAYSTFGEPMIPFYIYYSMFATSGGDLVWAFSDSRGRDSCWADAGRTTLNGEASAPGRPLAAPLLGPPHVRVYDPPTPTSCGDPP